MQKFSIKFVRQLQTFLKKKKYELHEPELSSEDLIHIKKCFYSSMISTGGEYVTKFENQIKKFTKSKYAVAVSNGTVGLFLALHVLDVKKNEEVLVPAISFVATANAVSHCGAIPHFIDIDKETLGIDCEKLENYLNSKTYIKKNSCYNKDTKRKISAIIPVHIFGHPCKIDKVVKLAKRFKLKVVEDAAEGLG